MVSKRLCLWTFFLSKIFFVHSTMYLSDFYLTKMIELRANNQPCKVHNDRSRINSIWRRADPRNLQVSTKALEEISKSCRNENQITSRGGFMYPGTKWCGPGTIANGYNDLGEYEKEDRCCREHDHCPNHLEPGQCRRGICNTSPYTRSHCDCDEEFRTCLRDLKSNTANIIGSLYFNVAQLTCFKERRSCPESMRDNLSYSWFCEEWKFMPTNNYIPSTIRRKNLTYNINQIQDEERIKTHEPSKINDDLETIFGKEDDITKIMKDYKTLRN